MGSWTVSVTVANHVMEDNEKRACTAILVSGKVDMLRHLNLKFTVVEEGHGCLPFRMLL